MTRSPLTRMRWMQFRRSRRAWGALILLAAIYGTSLLAGHADGTAEVWTADAAE